MYSGRLIKKEKTNVKSISVINYIRRNYYIILLASCFSLVSLIYSAILSIGYD